MRRIVKYLRFNLTLGADTTMLRNHIYLPPSPRVRFRIKVEASRENGTASCLARLQVERVEIAASPSS